MTFAYSAVIPAYNAARTIREAVDSILKQTIPPLEIIVVDDGSDDGTAEVARAIAGPITVVTQDNRGPGAATTAGFARVTTPFVATLDSDDLWLPDKIARQSERYLLDPDLAGVFALARLFKDGTSPDQPADGPIRRLWTRTTLVFRSDAMREVGDLVDPPGRLGELIDWLARSRDLGHRHEMVEEVLALRRIRPGSLSYGIDAERSRGYLTAIRNTLERRRKLQAEADRGNRPDEA